MPSRVSVRRRSSPRIFAMRQMRVMTPIDSTGVSGRSVAHARWM